MKPKTPSQRLRAALYVLYEHKNVNQDFEEWYTNKMEQIITAVKKAIRENENN